MTEARCGAVPLVLPLAACGLERLHDVGGKAARLGALERAGFRGAPGFVLTTSAYRALIGGALERRVNNALCGMADEGSAAARLASRRIRRLIEAEPMPPDCRRAILDGYAVIAHEAGMPDPPVAIRSSATAECLATRSFAGQQETFLWVRGAEPVIAHVRKVWSSLFSPQAILYRKALRFPTEKAWMAVVMQRMVDARTAGVTFTMNPANGDRSKIAIEANWGFGESVVSGEAIPDRFLVEKATLQILTRTIAVKPWEYDVAAGGGLTRVAVAATRCAQPCLSDCEVQRLAAVAKAIEHRFGEPQDIEWAIDRNPAGGDGIVVLQSRPETAWKAKPARCGPTPTPDAVSYVLRGLSMAGRARAV